MGIVIKTLGLWPNRVGCDFDISLIYTFQILPQVWDLITRVERKSAIDDTFVDMVESEL